MTTDASEDVRAAILVQLAELQSALALHGVERVRASVLMGDGNSGPQCVEFLDHEGQPLDVGAHPFGIALPGILLGRDRRMLIIDFGGEADLRAASRQVLENMTEYLQETGGFEAINRIDVEVMATGALAVRVDVGAPGEAKVRDWQISPEEGAAAPSL
jgi:hypothetical protein